jgi:hypothetical protein
MAISKEVVRPLDGVHTPKGSEDEDPRGLPESEELEIESLDLQFPIYQPNASTG